MRPGFRCLPENEVIREERRKEHYRAALASNFERVPSSFPFPRPCLSDGAVAKCVPWKVPRSATRVPLGRLKEKAIALRAKDSRFISAVAAVAWWGERLERTKRTLGYCPLRGVTSGRRSGDVPLVTKESSRRWKQVTSDGGGSPLAMDGVTREYHFFG